MLRKYRKRFLAWYYANTTIVSYMLSFTFIAILFIGLRLYYMNVRKPETIDLGIAAKGDAYQTDFTLVSDSGTGIVYIQNKISGRSNGIIYTPYYSKNGKLCRYESGKIIEIK